MRRGDSDAGGGEDNACDESRGDRTGARGCDHAGKVG